MTGIPATRQHQPQTHRGENLLNPSELIKNMNAQTHQRFDQLWADIDKMSESQFSLPFEPDHRSVSDHLQLVTAEYQRWLDFLGGDEQALLAHMVPQADVSRVELRTEWLRSSQRFQRFFESQSTGDLTQTIDEIQGPMWEVLIHVMMVAEEHHNYMNTILAHMGLLPEHNRSNRDLWQYKPEPVPQIRPINSLSA